MNNHPNEWREIGLALNTHVLKLRLIKTPSAQGKAESPHHSKARELAALVHGLICSLFGHFRCSGDVFPPLPLASYPLKAERGSFEMVFLRLLTCSQWMLFQLEAGSCTRLQVISGLAIRSLPQLGKISLTLHASVSPSPTDMRFLHAESLFSLKQRLSPTRDLPKSWPVQKPLQVFLVALPRPL